MLFKCDLDGGVFGVGSESLECALFDEADVPWGELAFPSIGLTLQHYFADRKANPSLIPLPQHLETIGPSEMKID